MSKQRGPLLLLILCAVVAVSGGYASNIREPAIRHASGFYGEAALPIPSAIDNWLGGTGNWSDPGNWDLGLPAIDSDVVINTGGHDYVFLDTDASAGSLTLGGTSGSSGLELDRQVLTIAGALTINQTGTLYLFGGVMTVGGNALNNGSIDDPTAGSGAQLKVEGTFTNNGWIQINSDSISSGSLVNHGTIQTVNSSLTANASFDNSGTVGLYSGSKLEVFGNASNSGTLTLETSPFEQGGGQAILHGNFNNSGVVTMLNSSDLEVGGKLSNGGTIDLAGSTLVVNGDVDNPGTLYAGYVDAGRSTVTIGGTLTNIGSFLLYGSFPQGDNATIGSIVNRGGIDLEHRSTLTVNGDVDNYGSMSTSSNPTFFSPGENLITIVGTLNNTGSFLLNGGTDVPSQGDSATLGSLINSGTIDLLNTSTLHVNGDVHNTGTISNYAEGSGNGGDISILGALNNTGSLLLSSDGLNVGGRITNSGNIEMEGAITAGSIVNSGAMEVDLGHLVVNGDVDNSGGIGLTINSTTIDGTLRNVGGFSLSDGGAANIGAIVNSGQLHLQNGPSIVTGSLVNSGTVSMTGGSTSFEDLGDASNSGQFLLQLTPMGGGGQLTIHGTLTNDPGGVLSLGYGSANIGSIINHGSIDLESSTLQVNRNVDNSGQFTTAYAGYGGNTLMVAGTLKNEPGGLFSLGSLYGGNDVANIGSVVNQAIVYISDLSTLNVTGGAHAGASALAGYTQTAGQTTVDGNLNILGKGMAVFGGGSVYGDQGTIRGTIISNADINMGDSPLTIGQLAFIGNYTQGPRGSLTFDIAGVELGQYDQLNITGHAQLNGLITVDLIHGFVPQIGNIFDIMNFSSVSGTFSLVLGLPINDQEHFVLEYNSTNLTLDVEQGQLLGPSAGPGSSFASDPFIPLGSDENGFTRTASNYVTPSAAPEPGSFLLFGAGLLCVGYSIRRRLTR